MENASAAKPVAASNPLKNAAINIALVVVSSAITYLILEVIFFRLMLPHLPLQYRVYLPDRADFFLQISKSQYVPKDYIALIGDSYAQGMGDWLLSLGYKSSEPYHSADVIHEKLGQDVASLGRARSGSAEAMVLRVARIFNDPYCYLFPAIPPPKRFLVYFYEGNDIEDNYELIQHYVRPDGSSPLAPQIDSFLQNQYAATSGLRCHGHLGDTIWKMIQYHVRFGLHPDARYNVGPVPPTNHILINGAPTNARELGGGAMAMDEKQLDDGVLVYDRSLAWFQRRFPGVPITLVYIPSPGAIYRYPSANVMSAEYYDPNDQPRIGRPKLRPGREFPASAIYAMSQNICERIRAVSLAHGIGFIDTRPAFRKAGAHTPLHGPRDWGHPNEAGYRLLGTLLAERIDEQARDACDDRWEP
jgi:hypothetical protein